MSKPSNARVEQILDDLAPLGGVEARSYFGGIAFVLDGRQFAMHLGNEFYFRVNDDTRKRFIEYGSEPFRYDTKTGERIVQAYYRVPAEVDENPALMLEWAADAVSAARR